MGRSVRGEKDYSVIMILGSDLISLLRNKDSNKYFSPQILKQIEIGLEIAELASQEIDDGDKPSDALNKLIRQCLRRDEDWKTYYAKQMDGIKQMPINKGILEILSIELDAEKLFMKGDFVGAKEKIQQALDKGVFSATDKYWYMQEMARYNYRNDREEAIRLQAEAHKGNHLLLKPISGIIVKKLTLISQNRVDRVINWIKKYENFSQLNIALSDILDRIVFGVSADKFEEALNQLSYAIGFAGERPDKEWKEGPDNLWALDDTQYIIWECKNEVEIVPVQKLIKEKRSK